MRKEREPSRVPPKGNKSMPVRARDVLFVDLKGKPLIVREPKTVGFRDPGAE